MKRSRKLVLGLTLGLAATTALSSCAEETAQGSGGGGEGVEYGASAEEYQEAFADVDPITIITQTPAAEGSEVGAMYEAYFDHVEEYSDGKITFDVSYANAIAGATEVDDALADGRLDAGNILPLYEPDSYPANAALGDTSFVGDQSPTINPLQLHAAMNEVAWETPQVAQELEDAGITPLLPWYSGDSSGILCPDPRHTASDLDGLQIVASGSVNALEIEELDASPISLDYTELYEALQRGTIDCSLNSMRVAALGGLIEVADDFTIDEEVGLGKTPGGFAFSKAIWDELPLVAQQLLFDSTSIMIEENITGSTQFQVDGLQGVVDAGGSVHSFDDAARQALEAAHQKALDQVAGNDAIDDGAALVEATQEATDRWSGIVADELGFDPDVTYAEFAEWHASEGYDLSEYTEKVFTEVMLPNRPS